jgi:hypothetical protein
MGRVLWLLNRAAAALAGASIVGCLAGTIMAVLSELTCGPTCYHILFDSRGRHCLEYGTTCGHLWTSLIFMLVFTPVYSVVLGTLPGIAALTLTPARKHPWRSLPILVLGTLIGFASWLSVVTRFSIEYGPTWFLLLFLIPTITGLAAAFNIERIPRRRNVSLT